MGARENLTILTDTWVRARQSENGRAVSVIDRRRRRAGDTRDRGLRRLGGHAAAAAAIGHRPADDLRELDIDLQHDLPGVGENLIDHPESIILWELSRPMPPEGVMDADCALFVNRLGNDDAARPDVPHLPAALHVQHRTARLPGAGALSSA